jgi:hypothetical protein
MAFFLCSENAHAISFTANSLMFNTFSCTYGGNNNCGNFFQTNFIVAPTGPNNANNGVVNFGGFAFTGDGNNAGTVSFQADANNVGMPITIVFQATRQVNYLQNETLQLLSSLTMNVSDPDNITIRFNMMTNFSVGFQMGFGTNSSGMIAASGNVNVGPNRGNMYMVPVGQGGSGNLIGMFTATFTPTLVTGNPLVFSFSNSADAGIADVPEPSTILSMGSGVLFLAVAWRRRMSRGKGHPTETELCG